MLHKTTKLAFFGLYVAGAVQLYAQTNANADTLILTDGEKLIGQLQGATDTSVVFKSNFAGQFTVDWSKVQELHSSRNFAAIPKGAKLRHREDTKTIPQGTVAANGPQLQIQPAQGNTQTVPVASMSNLVEADALQHAFTHTSFFSGWKGGATAGLSLTEATQKDQTVTAAVNMVRAVPGVNWLDVRSRTIFDFNEAYGKLSQPNTPNIKTSLYHLDAEQDWYLSPRLFAFGSLALDHSFSQGLDLQQTYGGGVGVVVIKTAKQELDFKASADYINQQFTNSLLNKKLFGSIFGETYVRTFAHKILLNEQAGITPAWNNTSAYSAFASAGLTFPVYHHFGLTLGALDNFLNDPPPGFRKNSFQFTLGATYSF